MCDSRGPSRAERREAVGLSDTSDAQTINQ
jgi:hypothetical protein